MSVTTREFHLASRPAGPASADNFALVDVPLPGPAAGQLLVRNTFMSVDPYMLTRMNGEDSYVPQFDVGSPLDGGAVGEVVESMVDGFRPGDVVVHASGWREHALVDGAAAQKVQPVDGVPLSAYLGVLGMPGMTAYVGLDMAEFRPGDTVFVSAAAGAVGSVAGQLARLRGAKRVIGSAGSPAKVAYLTGRAGFDAAFDYHDGPIQDQLAAAAPDGIDVYFDNVGGEHLEAAIEALRPYGRVAVCGAISQYDASEDAPGVSNLWLAIFKQLTLRGFVTMEHYERFTDFLAEVTPLLASGKLLAEETVVDGFERASEAFLGLLRGENLGKMIVRL